MTTTAPRHSAATFTADVEAQYSTQLRASRDRSDAEIREDFVRHIDDDRIAYERIKDAHTSRYHLGQAVTQAVTRVITLAEQATLKDFGDIDGEGSDVTMSTLNLEAATITVSVTDLVATATLTLAGATEGPS